MGPPENRTRQSANQERGRKRPARLPRTRRCLLKGCERRFRPKQARERYCSPECRRSARDWSCWKAQQSYRATAAGRENRQGQSRRYRERVRNRQQPAPEPAVPQARVITTDFFSTTVAIAPAATRDSRNSRDRRANDSVRARAGEPWNASGNANAGGARPRGHGCGFQAESFADNPGILIGNARPAYIRSASERKPHGAALGRRKSAASEDRRNR
jgi:hypothetical protein